MTREMRSQTPGPLMRTMQRLMPTFTLIHVRLFRLFNGGLGTDKMTLGAPALLLTTKGRRTGVQRSVPLGHVEVHGHVIVAATNGGLGREPAWVLNLRADPRCVVQIRGERFDAAAEFLDDEEYEFHWSELAGPYPSYNQARSWTRRRIPLVRLRRIGSEGRS